MSISAVPPERTCCRILLASEADSTGAAIHLQDHVAFAQPGARGGASRLDFHHHGAVGPRGHAKTTGAFGGEAAERHAEAGRRVLRRSCPRRPAGRLPGPD